LLTLRDELVRYGMWALAWVRYGAAWADYGLRARGIRPLHLALAVAVLGGAGAVSAAALSGWPVPIGAAAREQARLAAVEHELAAVRADLTASKLALARAQVGPATATRLAGAEPPGNASPALLHTIADLQAVVKSETEERKEAQALYRRALADLARSEKERQSLAAVKARLEHRLIALHRGTEAPESESDDAQVAAAPPEAGNADTAAAPAGFDLRRFLSRLGVRPSGEGGPFVPVGSMRSHGADPQAMKILRSLPLSAPLAHFVIASPFGVRADPINEHQAFHTGVDFDAPYRSPVYNTAPGVVVFAGWAGAYGRMVEIDHGHGIHTRYCHLNRITVTVGEVLRRRVRIGLLGSTGRSTGPHVHYEVRVDGVPQDPEKFLRAGRSITLVDDGG
jgi:murein DD-endopeptidase MepM/ murein hydrolase activator NlpD